MNAIEITKDELRPTGAPGFDVSKEPVPGASHALTPLQQLKPWDHQELVSRNGAGGEVTQGGERGGAVSALERRVKFEQCTSGIFPEERLAPFRDYLARPQGVEVRQLLALLQFEAQVDESARFGRLPHRQVGSH